MATPPESPRFPNLLPLYTSNTDEFSKALTRRDWIIKQIGMDNLELLEAWAFKNSPYNPGLMVYDSHITFHWNNTHSTKGVSDDPDQAVRDILRIWQSRFSPASDELQIQKIDQYYPGPGLDDSEGSN